MTIRQDRLSYLWLVVAVVLGFFTFGDFLIPLAVWLSPLFTLRFLRTQPLVRGFGLVVLATVAILHVVLRGVVPIPGIGFSIFIVIAALMAMLPYLADRLLVDRLPPLAATLVFPLAVTSLEYVNAMGAYGTFGSVAYTQAGNLPLLQLVSVTGLWGIVFLIHWLASLVNWAWEQGWAWPRVRGGVALYASLLAAVMLFGTVRLATAAPATETLRMAAIPSSEASIATLNEQFPGLLERVMEGEASPSEQTQLREALRASNDALLARSVTEAEAGARIVFWAEANAVVLHTDEAALVERGREVAREHDLYLGMAVAVFTPGQEQFLRNKIILVEPTGEVAWEYLKAYPVPGGEADASISGVAHVPTLDTAFGRLAAVICFDMDHQSYIRQVGQGEADLLVAPSNDWPEVATLHAQMSTFRAIENGVALLRPASQGISLAADPYGRVLAQSDFYATDGGALVAQVPIRAHVPTLYSRIGDAFAWLCLVALVGLAGWAVARRFRARPMPVPSPQP